MAELIYVQDNGKLAFGDYTLAAKAKADGFEFGGDLYKVKTFQEITKLERNGMFAYESVPGTNSPNSFRSSPEAWPLALFSP